LIERKGTVLSRDELLQEVWGYKSIPLTRTVDVHIAWLRQKIEEDAKNPLERFPAKWIPVRVKKTRQYRRLELRSDSIGTEKALVQVGEKQRPIFTHTNVGHLPAHAPAKKR
jgi:hypothetical protein